jgi:putative DNA primase/helicase
MDDPPNVAKLVDAALARDKARATRKEAAADCSEDQLAIAFVDRHELQLRYVALWGKWVKWAGAYWEQETTLAAFDLARSLCREAAPAKAKTVAAVEMLSRSDRRVAATVCQWDADKALFNTPKVSIHFAGMEKSE